MTDAGNARMGAKLMNISISSYSFHGLLGEGRMDVFGFLESCKCRYGLSAVEIWNGTMGGKTDEEYLRKVRSALDERELTLANLCVDGPHVWVDDPAERKAHYELALQYLRAAEILGARTLRMDMGGSGHALSGEQLDYVAGRYREYAVRAGNGGFRVGPETHWGPSLTPAAMKQVHDAVDHPAYGILLHVGHWDGGPEQERVGDALAASWAMHTHIDARITATCLEEKLRLLIAAGYQGHFGVEHHSAKNEYWEVAWQLAELRRALVRLRGEGTGRP
jgi:sugar phosphate isomerase/epimerase